MEVVYYQDILCVIYDKNNYNGVYDIIREQLYIFITSVDVFMSSNLMVCVYMYIHSIITLKFMLLLISMINNLQVHQIIFCLIINILNLRLLLIFIKTILNL